MGKVPYPPTNVFDYSEIEFHVFHGLIPIRVVVMRRVDGWCAYFLLKYMPQEYAMFCGSPTDFDYVRTNGDKLPEAAARELFPEMDGPYAY